MKRTLLFRKCVYLLPAAFAEAGSMVLLAASIMMLISSGCMSQAQAIYEARTAEVRTHYASWNVIDANELEEFAIGCPPQMRDAKQSTETTYQIVAFRTIPLRQVLYVLRSKVIKTYTYWEGATELNALDIDSGNWLWPSWIPVGGRYNDSAIAPDGNSMALITQQNVDNRPSWPGWSAYLSVINLEIEGRQVSSDVKRINLGCAEQPSDVFYSGVSYYRYSWLRFSPDGKYLAVHGVDNGNWAIRIYRLPLSDYDNDAKKPISIRVDEPDFRYESDPDTPSYLHVFSRNLWGKMYHGVFDTETGKEVQGMHVREDLRNFGDVCVVGNRILVIHGGDLTTFKPGDLTEVDTQCPLVAEGVVVSKTERFVVVGRLLNDNSTYILSIFDARNLNKPPSEVRILGLSPKENYSPPLPPPTAIVGDYLLVLRVRYIGSFWKGTQCDACTILRYDLRKIPSLWVQNEETQ